MAYLLILLLVMSSKCYSFSSKRPGLVPITIYCNSNNRPPTQLEAVENNDSKSSEETPIINNVEILETKSKSSGRLVKANPSKDDFNKLLEKELANFQAPSSSYASNLSDGKKISNVGQNTAASSNVAKDVLSSLLVADFFLVMFFLGWFILAAALQSTNAYLLERFQDIFNPVVVPSLTLLMVGSIASGLLGGSSGEKKD